MVLSDGKSSPSLLNSHLMAETPTWAKGSDSSRSLIETMSCLFLLLVLVDLLKGALGLSLYQPKSPLWNRLSHLKNHFFERFRSLYISFGFSPLRYLSTACFRISSFTCYPPSQLFLKNGSIHENTYPGNLCPDTKNGVKSNLCLDTSGNPCPETSQLRTRH